MKWAHAICALTLALMLAVAPAAADELQGGSIVRPPDGATTIRPTSDAGGGTCTTFGDPDDIIDGNRSHTSPPTGGILENVGKPPIPLPPEVLVRLLLRFWIVP